MTTDILKIPVEKTLVAGALVPRVQSSTPERQGILTLKSRRVTSRPVDEDEEAVAQLVVVVESTNRNSWRRRHGCWSLWATAEIPDLLIQLQLHMKGVPRWVQVSSVKSDWLPPLHCIITDVFKPIFQDSSIYHYHRPGKSALAALKRCSGRTDGHCLVGYWCGNSHMLKQRESRLHSTPQRI